MIDTSATFRTCSDTRYRNVGGEGVVVRQTAGEVLVLNDVGVRVLDLLATGKAVSIVVEALAGEYDVDPTALARDVAVYVQELLDAGIIERMAA